VTHHQPKGAYRPQRAAQGDKHAFAQNGKPVQMAVELARELQLSDKQKEKDNKQIGENTHAAQKRSEKLKELDQHDNGYNW